MAYIYEKNTGQRADPAETAKGEAGRLVANMIYNGFRLNKLTSELPSLWLGAGFHAAVRWDLKRKFKANDMPDFRHAVAAIPYCDYLPDEKSLRHLVSDKNLRLETLFCARHSRMRHTPLKHWPPLANSLRPGAATNGATSRGRSVPSVPGSAGLLMWNNCWGIYNPQSPPFFPTRN